MEWLRQLFGWGGRTSGGPSGPAATCDEAESKLEECEQSLEELSRVLQEAEACLAKVEAEEESMREEGERVIMEAHDTSLTTNAVPPQAQDLAAAEVLRTLRHITDLREAQELRILRLELRRAELLGEQRKARDLLGDLGRSDPFAADPSIPAYPNVVLHQPAEEEQDEEEEEPGEKPHPLLAVP